MRHSWRSLLATSAQRVSWEWMRMRAQLRTMTELRASTQHAGEASRSAGDDDGRSARPGHVLSPCLHRLVQAHT